LDEGRHFDSGRVDSLVQPEEGSGGLGNRSREAEEVVR